MAYTSSLHEKTRGRNKANAQPRIPNNPQSARGALAKCSVKFTITKFTDNKYRRALVLVLIIELAIPAEGTELRSIRGPFGIWPAGLAPYSSGRAADEGALDAFVPLLAVLERAPCKGLSKAVF